MLIFSVLLVWPGHRVSRIGLVLPAMLLIHLAWKPFMWCASYALEIPTRRWIVAFWATTLALALPIMQAIATSGRMPNIVVRKGYHALAVFLFLPALLYEPQLLGMAQAVAFCGLAVVEVVRLGRIPVLSQRLDDFMAQFLDERDGGAFLVTHFTLLLGMAAPIWLSNAMDDWSMANTAGVQLWPAALAGIIMTGIADAAASIIGSTFGRYPIARGSRKTIEGTAAGAVAALVVWAMLLGSGLVTAPSTGGIRGWLALGGATLLSSLLEATTEQLDNIFVGLHYFALLCCLS